MTEVKREHREAAIALCHGSPARCCRDWAEHETAPQFHTAASRIAKALAEAEQRGAERERAAVVKYLRAQAVQTHKVDAIESAQHLKGEE